MPWQDVATVYITAKGPDGWLYRHVAVVVGRQNGKTTLIKPVILHRLREGRHIMHIAQVRELPRIMFEHGRRPRGDRLRPVPSTSREDHLAAAGWRVRVHRPEQWWVVPHRGGHVGRARGHRIDDLIVDELREMKTSSSTRPSRRCASSDNPQMIYLSNAGTDDVGRAQRAA